MRRVRPRRAISGMGHVGRRLMRCVARRRPRRRRSWWCHTPLIDSGYPNPCEAGGVQMRPGCAHLLAMLQERHRLAGGFAAYPAPYCATGTLPGPRPRARRSPPPPRARDLERFTPQPGQPAQRSQDSMSSTRPHSPTLNSEEPENVACNSANRPSRFESER